FTAGEQEVRAWTFKKGMKAPQAAAIIHTDIEKGFIRAETVSYDDLLSAGSRAGARENGRDRLEGKEYIVKDGDVNQFRFNVKSLISVEKGSLEYLLFNKRFGIINRRCE